MKMGSYRSLRKLKPCTHTQIYGNVVGCPWIFWTVRCRKSCSSIFPSYFLGWSLLVCTGCPSALSFSSLSLPWEDGRPREVAVLWYAHGDFAAAVLLVVNLCSLQQKLDLDLKKWRSIQFPRAFDRKVHYVPAMASHSLRARWSCEGRLPLLSPSWGMHSCWDGSDIFCCSVLSSVPRLGLGVQHVLKRSTAIHIYIYIFFTNIYTFN